MIVVAIIILLLYIGFISTLFIGWRRLRRPNETYQSNSISVLVPVRNEAKSITRLLQSLENQHYKNYEVVVIDDHSEDGTAGIVSLFASEKIKCIPNGGVGKKQAIATGVREAKGDIIVTTDGDCEVSLLWLNKLNNYFSDDEVKLVAGSVIITPTDFFSTLQQMEFSSLIGSAASAIGWQKPLMCNGANLAYRKEAFYAVRGFEGNENVLSGDDEFLLHKIDQTFPRSIRFATETECIVKTAGQSGLKAFVHQRWRWASKWRFNQSAVSVLTAVFILSVQLLTMYMFYRCCLGELLWISLFLLKTLADLCIINFYCRWLEIRWSWLAFICLQLIYPFYVVFIGFTSQLSGYRWKGRDSTSMTFIKTSH